MDALVLSCGTGGGHDSAAKAISEELRSRGHKAVMLNPYTLKSDKLAQKINNSYISMVQKMPRLFGDVYKAGQLYRKLPCKSPVYHINKLMIPIMEKYLSDNHFDVVIMTHLFPAEIFTHMKNDGMSIPKTIFVATDYVCIPFTEETDCDAYIIPSKDLTTDFLHRGISEDKIYPFGIPTNSTFIKNQSKEESRKYLNLEPNKKYILISGGSMGGGTIKDAIKVLINGVSDLQDTELIIVCGSNKKLYEKLVKARPKNTIIVGYTDDMATYMRASDIFITKPGGLSSTEAAVCRVPILHTAAIPGCELYNAEYFRTKGMSVLCQTSKELLSVTIALLSDTEKCDDLVNCQKRIISQSAAADICIFAESITKKE